MQMWLLLLYIAVSGVLGGVVNALITDKGLYLPNREKVDQITIYKPGWIGNVIFGALAAAISWGLYGPLAAFFIADTPEALKTNTTPDKIGLTLSSLVGAALIGVGGARWLTSEQGGAVGGRFKRFKTDSAVHAKSGSQYSEQMVPR